MENFVVSARKYRPTGFEEVVGQEHITTTLQNAIDKKQLAQALLFCGPRGVGKTTCARILAKMINGFDQQEQVNPLNIYELDAASNNSVDDIRNLIDQVRYPPQQGNFKVYIIDEVHMLSNQAFNAFLKTLEEPPSYAIFILATTEKHKVIPTILSRCQIFDFNRIQISDIVHHLEAIAAREGIKAEDEALNLIAQKADGALRDALSIFDLIVTFSADRRVTYQTTIKNLHILDYDYYFKVTDLLLEQHMPQVMLIFDEILKKGFDGHNFIVGLAEHFRNLMVCKDAATVKLLQVSENVQARYLQQAKDTPLSFLLTALNMAGQCDLNYKSSKNQRLHVELALVKMTYIQSAVKLAQTQKAESGQEEGKKKSSQPINGKSEVHPVSGMPPSGTVRRAMPPNGSSHHAGTKDKPAIQLGQLKNTVRIPDPATATTVQQKAVEETAVMEEVQVSEVQKETPVDIDSLKAAWKDFAEQRKKLGKESEYMILNQEVALAEDGLTIPVKFSNVLQEDLLNGIRPELVQHLRKALNNRSLNVTTRMVREEKQRRLYTPSEKLNYLIDKYPALQELKEKLGLDPDF